MSRRFDRHRSSQEPAAPPMTMWAVLGGIGVAFSAAVFASPHIVETPMPTAFDRQFFRGQLLTLHAKAARDLARGEQPLRIVFLGTSRMKNAVLDSALVTRSARAADIDRPVHSTFMGVNWGGGERFQPVFELLEKYPPDVLVVTTSLLAEDYSHWARRHILLRYIRSHLEGQSLFQLFNDAEFRESSCKDFTDPLDQRIKNANEWLVPGADRIGPNLVADAARTLAARGTLVVVADVPPTTELQEKKALHPTQEVVREAGLAKVDNVAVVDIPADLPKSGYCDWAHFEPSRAGHWQQELFSELRPALNDRQPD